MKTSSRNILKLRVALQNMYSAEHLQEAASDIAIILTISNGFLENALKIKFIMWLEFQIKRLNAVFENKISWNCQKKWEVNKIQVTELSTHFCSML